jgi:hypothetical protein
MLVRTNAICLWSFVVGDIDCINKNKLEVRQMKWISVKDKLPVSLEDVLFTDGGGVYKGYRLVSSISEVDWDYWYSVTENRIKGVTHWMPLPELPK